MPKETFWDSATAVENDGVSEPVLTVTWHENDEGVYLNGVKFDYSGIERLAKTLRRATGKERTVRVALVADTEEFDAAMEASRQKLAALNDEWLRNHGLSHQGRVPHRRRAKGEEEFTSTRGVLVWRTQGGQLAVGNHLKIDAQTEEALREYFLD